MDDKLFADVLTGLLRELLGGPPPDYSFVLNPGDKGIAGSLARLSATEASARPNGRSSVASHVHHLRYGFELVNRWARGDTQAFANANYAASWEHQQVSDAQWRALRDGLEQDVRAWLDSLAKVHDWNHLSASGATGITVHLAYHLGAIRQVAAAAAGPSAND